MKIFYSFIIGALFCATLTAQDSLQSGETLFNNGLYQQAVDKFRLELSNQNGQRRLQTIQQISTCLNILNKLPELDQLLIKEEKFILSIAAAEPLSASTILLEKITFDWQRHEYRTSLKSTIKLQNIKKLLPGQRLLELNRKLALYLTRASLFIDFSSNDLQRFKNGVFKDYYAMPGADKTFKNRFELNQIIYLDRAIPTNSFYHNNRLNTLLSLLKQEEPLESLQYCLTHRKAFLDDDEPIKFALYHKLAEQLITAQDDTNLQSLMNFYRQHKIKGADNLWFKRTECAFLTETDTALAAETIRSLERDVAFLGRLDFLYARLAGKISASDPQEAQFWLKKSLASQKISMDDRYGAAIQLYRLHQGGNEEEQAKALKLALNLSSNHTKKNFCLLQLARLFHSQGKDTLALSHLSELEKSTENRDYFEGCLLEAQILMTSAPTKGLSKFTTLLELPQTPEDIWQSAMQEKITILKDSEDWPNVLKSCQIYSKRFPKDSKIADYLWLAAKIEYLQNNNSTLALELLENLKEFSSGNQPHWFLKASRLQARLQFSEPEEVEKIWRQVLKQPGIFGSSFEAEAILAIAQSQQARGLEKEALTLYRSLLDKLQGKNRARLFAHILPLYKNNDTANWPLPNSREINTWQLPDIEKLSIYRTLRDIAFSRNQLLPWQQNLQQLTPISLTNKQMAAEWQFLKAESNFKIDSAGSKKILLQMLSLSRNENLNQSLQIQSALYAIEMSEKLNYTKELGEIALEAFYTHLNRPLGPLSQVLMQKISNKIITSEVLKNDEQKQIFNKRLQQKLTATERSLLSDTLIDNADAAQTDGFPITAGKILSRAQHIAIDENSAERALQRRMFYLIQSKKWHTVTALYDQSSLKSSPHLTYLNAWATFKKGDYKASLQSCLNIEKSKTVKGKLYIDTILLKGLNHIKIGNFNNAAEIFEALHPDARDNDERIQLSLFSARCWLFHPNPVKAGHHLEIAEKNGAQEKQTIFLKLWLHILKRQAPEALSLYAKNTGTFGQINENSLPSLLIELADLLAGTGKEDGAAFVIKEAIKLENNTERAHAFTIMQAEFFLKNLQEEIAVKTLEGILASDPPSPYKKMITFRLAGFYTISKPEKAIDYYTKLIESKKNGKNIHFYSHLARARLFERQDRWQEACKDYIKASSLAPNKDFKGRCFYQLGHVQKHEAEKNGDKQLMLQSARVFAQAGHYSLELNRDARLLQADAHMQAGERQKATEIYSKITQLYPIDKDVLYRASLFFVKQKDYARGSSLMYRLGEIAPGSQELKEIHYRIMAGCIFNPSLRNFFRKTGNTFRDTLKDYPDAQYLEKYQFLLAVEGSEKKLYEETQVKIEGIKKPGDIRDYIQHLYGLNFLNKRKPAQAIVELRKNYRAFKDSEPGLESLYLISHYFMLNGKSQQARHALEEWLFSEKEKAIDTIPSITAQRFILLYTDILTQCGAYVKARQTIEEIAQGPEQQNSAIIGRYADSLRLEAAYQRSLSNPESIEKYRQELRSAAKQYEKLMHMKLSTVMQARTYYCHGVCYELLARSYNELNWDNGDGALLKAKSSYNILLEEPYVSSATFFYAKAAYDLNRIFIQTASYNSALSILKHLQKNLNLGKEEAALLKKDIL